MKAINEIVSAIYSEKTLAKHIYKSTWLSGSSTTVYPIEIYERDVCIQLDTHKNVFKKCIEKIIANYPHLFNDGYFCKLDGSCPSEIRFCYTDDTICRLKDFN